MPRVRPRNMLLFKKFALQYPNTSSDRKKIPAHISSLVIYGFMLIYILSHLYPFNKLWTSYHTASTFKENYFKVKFAVHLYTQTSPGQPILFRNGIKFQKVRFLFPQHFTRNYVALLIFQVTVQFCKVKKVPPLLWPVLDKKKIWLHLNSIAF